ncbi:MAG: DUF1499 domain-containing protein [Halobacteriovoraceae bacterium]|nr:DUF1499 domain-containing protein [Halobacteriovoraceae bacterium]
MKRLIIIFVFLSSCSGTRPKDLGTKEGKLLSCPEKPNCVSSFADPSDSEHYIKPIDASKYWDKAYTAIQSILQNDKVNFKKSEKYFYAEYVSTIFRFVDDVEFYFDEEKKIIHMRSASRIGHSDFGVNRERMEMIRLKFIQNEY